MMMIDPVHTTGWLALGRLGLEVLRSGFGLLHKGARNRAARKPDPAELGRALVHARLARDLGYRLCRCQFPPKPMLWDKARKVFVCPDPDCGSAEG
jgi:hypothetical protein